jgi:hypothetical protein
MQKMPLRYLGFIFMFWLGPSCLAQAVTVRVINANDHRPLRNQLVRVALLYDKGETTPEKFEAELSFQTDANGEAQFALPEPPPAHIDVRVRLERGRWHCGCLLLAVTQDIMNRGIVESAASANELKRSPDLIKAVPGEIRFVVRPASFWERLLYPFVKG